MIYDRRASGTRQRVNWYRSPNSPPANLPDGITSNLAAGFRGISAAPTNRRWQRSRARRGITLSTSGRGSYDRQKKGEHFANIDRKEIIEDLRDFYKNAEGGRFKKYLEDFERAVKEMEN